MTLFGLMMKIHTAAWGIAIFHLENTPAGRGDLFGVWYHWGLGLSRTINQKPCLNIILASSHLLPPTPWATSTSLLRYTATRSGQNMSFNTPLLLLLLSLSLVAGIRLPEKVYGVNLGNWSVMIPIACWSISPNILLAVG